MENERILILDFGGQYNQLIARRVRECHVYCEVRPHDLPLADIRAFAPAGIIFTGGPHSVYAPGAPDVDPGVFALGVPILGICYGCQLLSARLGGEVVAAQDASAREYGKTDTQFDTESPIFQGLPAQSITWMSHGDYMARIPEGFAVIARSKACPNAAIGDDSRRFYGVQFHPEVKHTQYGLDLLKNFLFRICGLKGTWTMERFRESSVRALRERIGDGKVLLGLSGGVDSSVCAALLSEAVGRQLTCIFVDHGLLRKGEGDAVEAAFAERALNFVRVDAAGRFLKKLSRISRPEDKRKIIGREFVRVFEEESGRLGSVDYLAQGTIYPDVIESGGGSGAAVIKSHHNVGGLPADVQFREIVEPLRLLFKDEVRALGRELELPPALVDRQPFPGPGLAVRIVGPVTKEKLRILREADAIFREEMARAGLEGHASQYFAALTNLRSVGVMGDGRSYDRAVALRAVQTEDFMTADWVRLPWELLDRVSVRIVNEVPGVNRVLYDVTSKPPATVEYE
ncbi:MAG: glutamine-hydrolyzing GMP synthase [Ruminococcaceae bacterium]|nr:glutamine-hydrolyzing GMP synthase [Oscillospiraceae bacterium]